VDVEAKFSEYGRLSLDPAMRREFSSLLHQQVQKALLSTVPSLLAADAVPQAVPIPVPSLSPKKLVVYGKGKP